MPGSRHPAAKSTWAQRIDGSVGPWVNGSNRSTGQLTGHFHFHYIIYDSRRRTLTPPRCKKHTAYDDTRLMPHRCKNHTASLARSKGKFPSYIKAQNTSTVHIRFQFTFRHTLFSSSTSYCDVPSWLNYVLIIPFYLTLLIVIYTHKY